MENNFVKNISLQNFKCFDNLIVKNLKRVNLIGGKNNIGKTSFLEGLEMLTKAKTSFGLRINSLDILKRRQSRKSINPFQPQIHQPLKFEFFISLEKEIKISSNINNVNIKYIPIGEKIESLNIHTVNPQSIQDVYTTKIAPIPFLEFSFGIEKFAAPVQDLEMPHFFNEDELNTNNNVIFISSCTTDESILATYYGKLISLDKDNDLNNYLNSFDTNIISLKAIPINIQGNFISELKLKLENRDNLVKLTSLGDGINRYIAIICAIWASKDGFLFIDEIENGIHYTNYEKLWKIIFEASKQANCQVFTTTHSIECIEAFNKINQNDDGIYLEFYRNQKNGLIQVKERDNEQLEYALEHNSEIRG